MSFSLLAHTAKTRLVLLTVFHSINGNGVAELRVSPCIFFSTRSEGSSNRVGFGIYPLECRESRHAPCVYPPGDRATTRRGATLQTSPISGRSAHHTTTLTTTLLRSTGPMQIADFARDSSWDVPFQSYSLKYQKYLKEMGTLANGGVFVAVSDLAFPKVMLGLFAGRDYKKNDPVVEYGGVLVDNSVAKADPKSDHSHTADVPDSDFVRNGKPFAAHFPITGDVVEFYKAELRYAVADRTRVEPVADSEQKNNFMRTMGMGFMANTDTVTNLKIERVDFRKDKLGPTRIILVANKPIKAGTELTLKYQMHVNREG